MANWSSYFLRRIFCLAGLVSLSLPSFAQDHRLRQLLGKEEPITQPCGLFQDSLLPAIERRFSFPLSPEIKPVLNRWEEVCGPVEPLLRTRLLYQHSMDSLVPPPLELLDYYGFYLRQLAARQNAPRYFFTPEALSYWNFTIQGAQRLQRQKEKPSLTLGLLGAENFHAARKYIWRSPINNPARNALKDSVHDLLFPRQFYEVGLYYLQFYSAAAQRLKPTGGLHLGIGGAWNSRQAVSLEFNIAPVRTQGEWRLSHQDSLYEAKGSSIFGFSAVYRQQIWTGRWQEGSLLFGLGFQGLSTDVRVWPNPQATEKTALTLSSYKVSGGLEWSILNLGVRRLAARLQYHLQDFNQGTTAVSDFNGNAATVGLIFFI